MPERRTGRMRFIIFFLSLYAFQCFSQVNIEVIPRNPSANEVFQILFKCNVEGREEPEINFDARNFEVLDKQSQGLSTRTIYQAGKITVSKEVLISYTAISKKAGMATIANTVVRIGGKATNKDDVSFQVSDKPVGPRLVFVAAEVSKDDVYINEGFTLRYYLYRRVGIQATDIKKYPKLDMFMKRYLQENENPQRVNVNGELFTRSTLYSARLYPEDKGEFVIDPIELTVSYSKENLGAFGFGFGMSGRDLVTKNISSEPIKIKVKPLPELGRPTDFSGLVGVHKFDFVFGRSNILVNEPLEAKLSINGPGNLESFTPVTIFNSKSLEQFDVKSDLALINSDGAVKTFSYTFLGKRNDEIPASSINISYFNVDTKKYEVWTQDLPEVRIAGGEVAPEKVVESNPINLKASDRNKVNPSEKIVLLESDKYPLVLFCVFLFLFIVFVFLKITTGHNWKNSKKPDPLLQSIRSLRIGNYGHKELAIIFDFNKTDAKGGIKENIVHSNLDNNLKKYFLDILETLDLKIKNGSDAKLPKISKKAIESVLEQKKNQP